ncbi:ImmA/IrrE family metallo-endopeptidase, partial [Amycolatopsis lurida]|uniref:ImmA/IrrE family metallo-endopeptidase n=1 Tax=Amycolatopsis lurida TaxID=31959 RepID=UPI0036615A83
MYRRPRAVVEAERFLAQHGTVSPPVPVEDIATWLGAEVVRAPSEGTESAFLVRDGRRVIIGVNSRQSRRRQRFSIAHELGHWQMHEGRPLIIDHSIRINRRNELSSAATDTEEIEANSFAAALLMPKKWVQDAVDREQLLGVNDRDQLTQSLAKEFDVSTEAMR